MPEIEQVVLKALSKGPQQRFESVQAFAQAFTAAFEKPLAPSVIVSPQPLAPTIPAMIQEERPAQQTPTVSAKTKQQWLDEGARHLALQQYDSWFGHFPGGFGNSAQKLVIQVG
jgi:hypothetical protein